MNIYVLLKSDIWLGICKNIKTIDPNTLIFKHLISKGGMFLILIEFKSTHDLRKNK